MMSDEDAERLIQQAQGKAEVTPEELGLQNGAARVLAPLDASTERLEEAVPGHRALTQLGNAERMVDTHGAALRYCPPLKSFFVWDGRRWREDDQGTRARELACDTVRRIYEEAADERLTTAERELLSRHAVRSESERAVSGMLSLVRSMPGIAVEVEHFDAEPYLLNVKNGTIDLRTGELRKHRRKDFLTQLIQVAFDPKAEAPLFTKFLDRIFMGDSELIDFVQRLLGYTLTGECVEQVMGVCYGTGKNGKSTLLNLVHDVLGGDYAVQLRPDFLLTKKWEAHPEELAQLRSRRFACAVEVNAGAKLDEARVKHLTGNDRISARRMYGSSFDFAPTHKFLVGVNDKPQVQGMDEAIWRRLLLIPFRVQIPANERDLELGKKLLAEAPGVLAWLVRGCLAWQKQHLAPPTAVVEASTEYRHEMDSVRRFLDSDACIRDSRMRIRKGELWDAYGRWCGQEGVELVPRNQWPERVKACGIKDGHFGDQGAARAWIGVALAGVATDTNA
jgi:putative DNA primase/helicase